MNNPPPDNMISTNVCWWCGQPADQEATDELTMTKKEWLSRKHFREHKKQVSILRCQRCKDYQSGDEWKLTLPSVFILLASGGGCYLGYVVQGNEGWMMYAFGIATFVILFTLLVIWNIRRVHVKMSDEERDAYEKATGKHAGEHPSIVALKEDGWSAL